MKIKLIDFNGPAPVRAHDNDAGADVFSPRDQTIYPGQVYKLPLGIYRSYTPSADTPMTLLWMAKTVYPELFADIDLTKEVKTYYEKLYGIRLSDAQVSGMFEPRANRADGFSQSGR